MSGPDRRDVVVLGSTGSIGTQALEIVRRNPDRFRVVGLTAGGYPVEVLEEVGRCGLTVLGSQHAIVASRFSSAGRPSARHLLESVPWTRVGGSGGIGLTDAPAALDCRLDRLVAAGDHVLALLEVTDVPVLDEAVRPLLRLRGRYVDETGGAAGRT